MSKTYWPQDNDCEIYIARESSLADILNRVEEKWPGVKMEDISIEADHIHTQGLGYDLYDSSDYVDFIVIRRKP